MRFEQTSLEGVFVVELERAGDRRGWFARSYCQTEFTEHGIEMTVAQANVSYNRRAGTLRGLHYQSEPHAERKLIRCTRGAIFDVAVDIRAGAPTRGDWYGTELSADNGRMLYVPEGFAHGFQTLEDGSEVSYLMSHEYVSEAARGVRWDDPLIGIDWPAPSAGERVISERDRNFPALDG